MSSSRLTLAHLAEHVAQELRPWALAWCVGGMAVIVMATGVGLLLHWSMRSSGAYQDALRELRRHPAAAEALGRPIEEGWMRKGSIMAHGRSRLAKLAIPVSGPKGTGMLYVEAVEHPGEWRMQLLQLAPATGARIDLLAAASGGARPRSAARD